MITKATLQSEIENLEIECKRCNHCCKYDSGVFLDEDIKRIAMHLGLSENKFKKKYLKKITLFNKEVYKSKTPKKPYGPCVFLKKDGCRVHTVKPLHCRLASGCHGLGTDINVWFFLKHIVDAHDPEAIRQWNIYLHTHHTIPGGKIDELVPDDEKRKKILNFTILKPGDE